MNCQHILQRGKNTGERCQKTRVDGKDFCRVHTRQREAAASRKTRAAAAEREINARERTAGSLEDIARKYRPSSSEKQPKPSKNATSMFHITINSNQAYDPEAEAVQLFYDVVEWLFGEFEILNFVRDKRGAGIDVLKLLDQVPANVPHRVEVAPKNNRVHCHALLRLQHHGLLHIDLGLIRQFLKDVMGKACRVFVQGKPDMARAELSDAELLEKYIYKGDE